MKGRSTRISRKLAVSAASLVALVIVSAVMANGIPRFSPGDSRQAAAQQLTPTPTPTLTPTATATASGNCQLWVDKWDNPDPVAEGGQITYAITVANAGSGVGECSDLTITDTIPADTDCTDASVDPSSDIAESHFNIDGCDTSGDVVWDTSSNLATGDQAVLQMVVQLTSGAQEGDHITNEVCATSTDDADGACATESTTVGPPGPSGSISGTVRDSGGNPIAYPYACAWSNAWHCGNSNSDGTYIINGLAPGSYTIWATADGYAGEIYDGKPGWDGATPVTVVDKQNTSGIDFALDLAASISGIVLDGEGNPIQGAHVEACPISGGGWCETSDTTADGRYVIDGLSPKVEYRVRATADGYLPEYWDDARVEEDASPVPLLAGQEISGIDFSLDVGGTISGTVTDSLGNPLQGCDVYADSWDGDGSWGYGYTDGDGIYTITSLATDSYRVDVDCEGYIHEYYNGVRNWEDATPVPVVEGQDTPGINFSLRLEGTISGTVEDSEANPVSGAKVCADSNDLQSCDWTDGSGDYLINGLIGGEYVVNAKAFGYVRAYYLDACTAGAATPVLVTEGEDTPNINFALDIGGTVTATITDGNANPIEDAWVAADPSQTVFTSAASPPDVPEDGGSCQTNASGQCTITGLATGGYLIRAGGINYLTSYFDGATSKADADPVAVVEGDDTTVALTLDPVGCGDTNEDRRTSMVDAMLIAQHVAGLIGSGNLNLTVADVNSSGSVSMVDAMLVAQYVAGLIDHLSCGLPASTPTPVASPTAGPSSRVLS